MNAAEAMEPVEAAVWGALTAASKRCQPVTGDVRPVMDAVGALAADLKPKPEPVRYRHPDNSGTDLHELVGVLAALLEDGYEESLHRRRQVVRDRHAARFAPSDDTGDGGTGHAA